MNWNLYENFVSKKSVLTTTDMVNMGAWYGPSWDSNSYTKFFFNSFRMATVFLGWVSCTVEEFFRRFLDDDAEKGKMKNSVNFDLETLTKVGFNSSCLLILKILRLYFNLIISLVCASFTWIPLWNQIYLIRSITLLQEMPCCRKEANSGEHWTFKEF